MDQSAYPDLLEETRKRISGLSSLSKAIVILFGVNVAIASVQALLYGRFLSFLTQVQANPTNSAAMQNLTKTGEIADSLDILLFIPFFLAGILFLIWIYKMHKLLHDCAVKVEYSPGWSVGWWFVPVMNWFKPYSIVSNLQHVVRIQPEDGTKLPNIYVGVWWSFSLISTFLDKAGIRMIDRARYANSVSSGITVFLISDILFAISGLLAIRIVRAIQKDLPERIRRCEACKVTDQDEEISRPGEDIQATT